MPKVMDKYTPTYNLDSFKKSKYGIKQSALFGAAAMGFELKDILQAVDSMLPEHFYKSMTSYQNYQIWQDVYHVPYKGYLIYIKFVQGTITEFDLISFKEK